MKPSKIAFEKRYSDDSDVEFAVRFDSSKDALGRDSSGEIEFECVGNISYPLNELDWLIECLQKIKTETTE